MRLPVSMATTANASTPKKGGTLRLGIGTGSTSHTFDPRLWADSWGSSMGRMVYNQLVQAGNDGKLQKELATGWSQSANGLKWTIKLRKGIKFSNGKEFTSEDAKYSLGLHFAKGSKSGAKGLLTNWKNVKTKGKYQIVIELSSPDQDIPWILNDYHLVMMPKGFKDWSNPVGTGGYRLKQFKPGVIIKGTRNPDYWKPNSAHFDEVHMISIKDATARINALMSGKVDIIDSVPTKVAKLIKKRSNLSLVLNNTGKYYNNPMITTKAPFNDNNVRMAVKYGVDRQALVDKILYGYGTLGNDQPISSGDEFYNPNIPQREYDTDKSKYYLKKAGMTSLNITLNASDAAYAGAVDASVVIQESLAKANINVNVVRDPADGYWSNTWMKKPFTACYWGRRPTAAMTFASTYRSGASWNDTFYNNKKFDKLLDTLQSSKNRSTRKRAAWKMQEILHNDGGQLIPMMPVEIDAINNKLQGMEPHPIYGMNDVRIMEKGWFA